METIAVLLGGLLLLLNMLGGLLSGVALLFKGEWGLVLGGIGWGFLGPFALSLAMLPGMIFAPLAVRAAERGNIAGSVIWALPSIVWTYVVVAVSCVGVFSYIASLNDAGFFHFVWAYAVSTGPWSFMAQKDRQSGNTDAMELMFFVQLGAVSMIVASLIDPRHTEPLRLFWWFLPFMVLGVLHQGIMLWARTRNPYARF